MGSPGTPHAQGLLQQAVAKHLEPVYMTSYGDIKEALIEKHGSRGWVGAMAQALTGSEARSGKEYLAARRSIERFEKGQFTTMRKYTPHLADVGKQLPPIGQKLKGNTLTITVLATQQMDFAGGKPRGKREREFEVTFTGPDAHAFAANPSYRDFFEYNGYPPDVIDLFEDGDYELDIYKVA